MGIHGFSDQVAEQAIQYNADKDELQVNKASNDVSFAFYKNGGDHPAFYIDAKTGKCTFATGSGATISASVIVSGNNDFYIKAHDTKSIFKTIHDSKNVCVGYGAGQGVPLGTSSDNVCIGKGAGTNLNNAHGNVLIGNDVATNLVNGSKNIIIGDNLSASSTNATFDLQVGRYIRGSGRKDAEHPAYLNLYAGAGERVGVSIGETGTASFPNNSYVAAGQYLQFMMPQVILTQVYWDTIQFDHQSEMDVGRRTFHPKSNGVYAVDCHVTTDSYLWRESDYLSLVLRKNNVIYRCSLIPGSAHAVTLVSMEAGLSTKVYLTTNDIIDIAIDIRRWSSGFTAFVGDPTRNYLTIAKVA